MITTTDQFDPKDPAEIIPITFEFLELTSAPTDAEITITRLSGSADSNPDAMKVGSTVIVGSQVQQKIGGGVLGAIYGIVCQVQTAEGHVWKAAGKLAIQSI